ncbi:hypothetical protein NECID01_1712 [Nematocida sp. AWRm77]|nr:hypothetical protein NECID01_1712 [Nematocida sp. AWRm77]
MAQRTAPMHKNKTVQSKPKHEYYKGVKQPLKKTTTRASRCVINKSFRTDEELTEFIFNEGTFKDRVTAMTLLTITETDYKAAMQLLEIAEEIEGADKAYLAITHGLKVAKYYEACKKEGAAEGLNEKDAKFVRFIEDIGFMRRLTGALRAQSSSPFLKTKIIQVLKGMMTSGTLEIEATNILMDAIDPTVEKEITSVIEALAENKKTNLLVIVKEKLVQIIAHHKNTKTVYCAMSVAFAIKKSMWYSTQKEFQECVVPMMEKYCQILKDFYTEASGKKEQKSLKGLGNTLRGLFRFLLWEKEFHTEGKEQALPELIEQHKYIIYKMAYHENIKYSLPALNILECMHDMDPKINYPAVLVDTIRKYIYAREIEKCEILNKALNQKKAEVHSKVISSSYITEIGGKYVQGCHMVISECVPEFSQRLGMMLHRKSYSPEIAQTAHALLQNKPIPVYNLWDTE